MTTANNVRARDPPSWRDAERIGRVSYLPPKAMRRTYQSELRRRELMAAEEADWRRLEDDISKQEISEAAFLKLSAAFADLFLLEPIQPFALAAGISQHKLENHNEK